MLTAASSPLPRLHRRRLALAVGALAALASCNGKSDNGQPAAAESSGGGTMVIAAAIEPTTLFPPRSTNSQESAVIASVFDRLAEIGQSLNAAGDAGFTPRLADSWRWAPDSLSIAFALNPRARWHDGVPVRAEDVRYSFHVYTSPTVASDKRSLLGNIDSVSVKDSLTAVFWFKRRTPQQFLDATYSLFILPAHLLASMPDSALADSPFSRAPIGSGRFRFAKWNAGAALELQSDTANYRRPAGLDRVIWSFVGDAGSAVVKLVANEADFLEKVQPDVLSQVASASQLRLVTYDPLGYSFVGMNLRVRRWQASKSTAPHPIFGDVRVRRALTMAVDRAKVVRTVYDSLGTVSLAASPRVLIPDTAALHPLAYNVAAAKALLDSAGWTDANGDGIREHNGQKLSIELLIAAGRVLPGRIALLLQSAFKDVGAELKVVSIDPTSLGPRIDASDYDACLCGYTTNPGNQGMRQTWMSRGALNSQGYADPAFDALVDSALTTFSPGKSNGYWTRALQLSIDDAPSIWLYEVRTPVAIHKRIRMAPMRADGWFANLADWTVDPAQRIARDGAAARGGR